PSLPRRGRPPAPLRVLDEPDALPRLDAEGRGEVAVPDRQGLVALLEEERHLADLVAVLTARHDLLEARLGRAETALGEREGPGTAVGAVPGRHGGDDIGDRLPVGLDVGPDRVRDGALGAAEPLHAAPARAHGPLDELTPVDVATDLDVHATAGREVVQVAGRGVHGDRQPEVDGKGVHGAIPRLRRPRRKGGRPPPSNPTYGRPGEPPVRAFPPSP